ncbi:CidA/LrgA family protein [Tropicibacter oceani]|uniref:CidA/LrgA family protein n=1 Tax=Tropicibacter oceani TaxID=3058420 RepID=A0ABY8QJZ8_9RHOB|nr:CidA/LrgA family protein [Tropicibacter oceani]WGW04472.1 CidA/LrgA family protein [Tropicibacter oceani]
MIRVLTVLLLFQLAGESLSRGLGMSVPGPVLGLAGLFLTLVMVPRLAEYMRATVTGLLGHLSLLFVPAGVGVVAHLDTFGRDGAGLIVALIASTVLAILAGVGAFLLVARLTGGRDV